MLRLFRARVSCLITAVVLAVGTTTASFDELLHNGISHDEACVADAGYGHDASQHRIGAGSERAVSEHCVACHLARAPRLGAQPAPNAGPAIEARVQRPRRTRDLAASVALTRVPGRSPPQFS